jgi:hypothetical protein
MTEQQIKLVSEISRLCDVYTKMYININSQGSLYRLRKLRELLDDLLHTAIYDWDKFEAEPKSLHSLARLYYCPEIVLRPWRSGKCGNEECMKRNSNAMLLLDMIEPDWD